MAVPLAVYGGTMIDIDHAILALNALLVCLEIAKSFN